MKITHYLYNTFLIEAEGKKIAIDPGGLFLYYFRLTTLIPKTEWHDITHIFITHGDPDHYWHADRVAEASGAAVVCNRSMLWHADGKDLMLGPRSKGVVFNTPMNNLHPIDVDETITLDGMSITGTKSTHGSLIIKLGPISKKMIPGPDERIGWGSMGFNFTLENKRLVNLGDTLLHTTEWESIVAPDVLMIPIGGKEAHNTMDENEALEAVRTMQPRTVIPCHYNCPGLFSKSYNSADDQFFKTEVEKMGLNCVILGSEDSVVI